MKRLFIYLLIVSVTFSMTDFDQLLSVPELFSHYLEHKEEEEDLSFIEFIHAHYCPEHKHCGHETEDSGTFPYQKVDSSIYTSLCISEVNEEIRFYSFSSSFTSSACHIEQFCSELYTDIWQPPKLVS
ncbi:MAG: hypothetical protein SGI87_02035 [Flavobacteriales bacterium]|nr:hypothetical protein [Flavobacteriales bacterium]